MPKWIQYAVTLWALDIPGRSWLYIESAPDGATAVIQARLNHARLRRPAIDPTRSIVKEK